jgi:hypothetical protein
MVARCLGGVKARRSAKDGLPSSRVGKKRLEPVGFENSSASFTTATWLGSGLLLSVSREDCLLWSFAYFAVRNLFTLVWLLARPRRSKELEILVVRHELAMLRRQARQPKLSRADRALLAALSRSLLRAAWAAFPVRPATLLRWHRQLAACRWTYRHRAPGRPPLESSLRALILRLGEENPTWGYRRIVGELKGLGICVSATTVRTVLLEGGLQPAPERSHSSWRAFLRAQAASMLACDFLTVETAFLQRIYVLFFISLATRRIGVRRLNPNPDGRWVTQQARNRVMQLGRRALLPLPPARPRQQGHARLRPDLPHRRRRGDPHSDPGTERQRPRRTLGYARSAPTASTASSSSDAGTSSTSSASTAATTDVSQVVGRAVAPLREFRSGAGDRELKRRRWGCLLPRCLAA